MNDVLEDALIELTDAYNAGQDAVQVTLQNQIGYDEALDKYIQSSGDSRPDMIQIPEFTLQSFAQSDTLIPAGACIEVERLRHVDFARTSARHLCLRRRRLVDAVQRLESGAVLPAPEVRGRRTRSRRVAHHARGVARHLPTDRRFGCSDLRLGARLRTQLGRRLVPRAMVRTRRSALCEQRERPERPGHRGAVRRTDRCRTADVRAGDGRRWTRRVDRRQLRRSGHLPEADRSPGRRSDDHRNVSGPRRR